MASASNGAQAENRLRLELWSWSAWLVLAVISYPAVVLISLAPRAGIFGSVIAVITVIYTASEGYLERRETESWRVLAFTALALGSIGMALAFFLDGITLSGAFLAGFIVTLQIVFAWHFLPWIVRDADLSESVGVSYQFTNRARKRSLPVRAALGLTILLALLVFGLGAVWQRGESAIPNPALWIVAVSLLALALMFVERLAFLERAAREGNLLFAVGSYRIWLLTALGFLVLLGLLAAIAPIYFRQEKSAEEVGTAETTPSAGAAMAEGLQEVIEESGSAMGRIGMMLAGIPRAIVPLLLLLLLLLLAVIVVWAFRKSRTARWLLSITAKLITFITLTWRKICAWFNRLLNRRREPASIPERPVDPLADPFQDIALLEGLTARDIVIHIYHLLLSFGEMLGHGRRAGQTPFEYANQLGEIAPEATESIRTLTWAYSGAMYGEENFPIPDPSSVRASWKRVESALTTGLSAEELALRRRVYLTAQGVILKQ